MKTLWSGFCCVVDRLGGGVALPFISFHKMLSCCFTFSWCARYRAFSFSHSILHQVRIGPNYNGQFIEVANLLCHDTQVELISQLADFLLPFLDGGLWFGRLPVEIESIEQTNSFMDGLRFVELDKTKSKKFVNAGPRFRQNNVMDWIDFFEKLNDLLFCAVRRPEPLDVDRPRRQGGTCGVDIKRLQTAHSCPRCIELRETNT